MAVPYPVEPMLAVAGELPRNPGDYALEVKWDGIRALAYVDGGVVRVTGRHGADFTSRYPEIAAAMAPLAGHRAVVDGEVVVFDHEGRPSFARLQRRMHVTDPAGAHVLGLLPASYLPFDLLHLDGHTLLDLPYRDRRALLDSLGLGAPPSFPCEPEVVEATRRQGLEGVVAKRLDSPYLPGRRTDWWIKVKNLRTTEVVVGGWRPGKGRRAGGVGSLLLGVYGGPPPGALLFAGHVGTGFTDAVLDDIRGLIEPLEIGQSPFSGGLPREISRNARWLRPEVVGEVAFSMWTRDGRLRNPVWRGVRVDKIPAEVRREER
ncbi:non-homologous end-joining DNA ligase [Microbispora amethystogenes]|uniref:DNA ligase (ATP) n=1 Tax=Microbispora amethystogenes TaxID=1427754 RepID=A0ABQ4FGY9_9ACTN|nr:non-homologous end-joining DNA ligase [Microbispora amethystogenes]GIH34044.1 hypothetical protein Mam01_42080 [Microbispora amethystogenes]